MTKYLFLYIAASSIGWLWIFMGISTHRTYRKVMAQERSRTTATVVELIPEEKQRWNSHRHRKEIRTVWHPVVEFTVDNQKYHLQSPANLQQNDLSVGDDVDIIYDADNPTSFHFREYWEHDIRTAKGFIAFGIVWTLVITPFLVYKAMNG